jgi:hypothetical protein
MVWLVSNFIFIAMYHKSTIFMCLCITLSWIFICLLHHAEGAVRPLLGPIFTFADFVMLTPESFV